MPTFHADDFSSFPNKKNVMFYVLLIMWLKTALKSSIFILLASAQESNVKTVRIYLQRPIEPMTTLRQKAWETCVMGKQHKDFRYTRRLKAAADWNINLTLTAFVTCQVSGKSKCSVVKKEEGLLFRNVLIVLCQTVSIIFNSQLFIRKSRSLPFCATLSKGQRSPKMMHACSAQGKS